MTAADFEWTSKLDRAISAGFDPGENYGTQPVDTTTPLPAYMVRRNHQASTTGCDHCGQRCDTCDDRMCEQWGPEPRACGVTCDACPCDCTACLRQREDMRDELLHQLEREAR